MEESYGRKLRQARQKGDEESVKRMTKYCKQTGGGKGLTPLSREFFFAFHLFLDGVLNSDMQEFKTFVRIKIHVRDGYSAHNCFAS
jgi:hypothetical protein